MTLVSDKMDHVTEDGIRQLVNAFYTKVRVDSELGPVFENKIKDNWPHHLEKMYAFWSSVMLTTGRYKGNPMMKHMVKAGESTGNVDGMMGKIADFYDVECEATVAALTSLIEPILIVFLGVVVGGIVMAMFLPIFQMGSVVGGVN